MKFSLSSQKESLRMIIEPPIDTTNEFGRQFEGDQEPDNIRSVRVKVKELNTCVLFETGKNR